MLILDGIRSLAEQSEFLVSPAMRKCLPAKSKDPNLPVVLRHLTILLYVLIFYSTFVSRRRQKPDQTAEMCMLIWYSFFKKKKEKKVREKSKECHNHKP